MVDKESFRIKKTTLGRKAECTIYGYEFSETYKDSRHFSDIALESLKKISDLVAASLRFILLAGILKILIDYTERCGSKGILISLIILLCVVLYIFGIRLFMFAASPIYHRLRRAPSSLDWVDRLNKRQLYVAYAIRLMVGGLSVLVGFVIIGFVIWGIFLATDAAQALFPHAAKVACP